VEDGDINQMKNLLTNRSGLQHRQDKKVYYLEAERLIKSANDNFVFFRDYESALDQAERVLGIDPENAGAYVLKGNVYFCSHEADIALEYYERALSVDPLCAEAHSLKANILDNRGKLTEALESCERAFESIKRRDHELLTQLYDQKMAILLKMRKYEDAKKTLQESFENLGEEDGLYLASCYRDAIENLGREKRKRREIAEKRLRLVHNS
jgi:tetratricopeptide (TPR) repeat protein